MLEFVIGALVGVVVDVTFRKVWPRYLSYAWMVIICGLTYELLRTEIGEQVAMAAYGRLEDRWYSYLLMGIVGALLALLYWWSIGRTLTRLALDQVVRPDFKASPLFTKHRQFKISSDINQFYGYLTRLGFPIPKNLPPIGVRNAPGVFTATPAPVSQSEISIAESELDKPNAITRQYAIWIFHELLPGQVTDSSAWFDMDAGRLYSAYFVSSFEDTYISPDNLAYWGDALWELRSKYGQNFVDRLLLYSFQSWRPPEPQQNDFDSFFWVRFLMGLHAIDNQGENRDAVLNIMKSHGLPRK